MSSNDIDLHAIADDLLIVDRRTINHLFELESCSDCVALYMFLYKTAKWQGTKSVKANDVYIRKCLGWGAKRVTSTKAILESAGLIKQVTKRKDGKILGHFIEVAYLLNHNTRKPLVDEATCGFGETNTNKSYIKCSNNLTSNKTTNVVLGETPKKEVVRSQRSLEIDEAFRMWEEIMGYPLTPNKTDRPSVHNMLQRKGMDLEKLRMLIVLVKKSQSDRYKRFSITDFTSLKYKQNELVAWAHEKAAQQKNDSKMVEVG